MNSIHAARLLVVLLTTSLVLTACGDKADAPPANDESPVASSDSPVATVAPNASVEMNEPLTADQVSITLAVEGQPRYKQDEDFLLFNINVANHGKTHLVGAGTKPVHLGVLLVGPEGPDKAPGLRDFVVVPLPLIGMGETKTVEAKLPAKALDGQTVQFQLLQGGVSWFDGFGQQPLNTGAYSRCKGDDANKTLCDSAGAPVAVF